MLEIKKVQFKEIVEDKNFQALADEYEAEMKHPVLPKVNLARAVFYNMEVAGLMYCFAAYENGEMIGFTFGILTIMPNYSVKMAVNSAIFVTKAHRHEGVGLKLVNSIEACSKELNCEGTVLSATTESQFAQLLPKLGYTEIDRIFYKKN